MARALDEVPGEEEGFVGVDGVGAVHGWVGFEGAGEWVSGWGNMEGSGGGRIQDEGTEFAVKVGDVCCGRGGGGCGRHCGS